MPKRKIFRTQFLVHPGFQMSLVMVNSFVLLGMGIAVGFATKTVFNHLNQVGHQIHLYDNHPFFQMVTTYSHHFYGFLVLTLTGALLVSNGLIIYLSHKAAGPIIQMENYFKNIVRRERAPRRQLRFRRGDYFHEIPFVVNSAVTLLRSGVSEDTQTVSNIKRSRY